MNYILFATFLLCGYIGFVLLIHAIYNGVPDLFNGNNQNDFQLGMGQMEAQRNMALQNAQLGQFGNAFPQGNPLNLPQHQYQPPSTPPLKPKEKSMFKEIATDIKAFVLEHRGVIYFIAFALILDHVFFKGAFKSRLQGMADKIVAKVEEKIQ